MGRQHHRHHLQLCRPQPQTTNRLRLQRLWLASQQTDPLGKVTTQRYDRFGNVVAVTDAKNQQTQLTWAYGHQLKTRTVKNPDGSVYTTDTLSRNPLTVTRTNPAINQALAYDPGHRLIRASESRNGAQAKTLTYDWSPGGLLNMMQDKYVGQSGNLDARLAQHVASGKITTEAAKTAQKFEVFGGKTAREVAEQRQINGLGGIEQLGNKVNPIGGRMNLNEGLRKQTKLKGLLS